MVFREAMPMNYEWKGSALSDNTISTPYIVSSILFHGFWVVVYPIREFE